MDKDRKDLSRWLNGLNQTCEGEFFRQSTIDDHKTKFELGDSVFVMQENKIVQAYICEINIHIFPMPTTTHLTQVKYKLATNPIIKWTSQNYRDAFAEFDEANCFATKEELLKTL